MLCDKATITFVVGTAETVQASGTKETIVISENSSQDNNSTSMISIGAALGLFLVLGAAAAYRKRGNPSHDGGFKGIPADVATGISTLPVDTHPHGSLLEHAYADSNNISVTSFLTGESVSPYGPKSKRSFLKKSKQSSSSSLFSNALVKSKKSAVVEDVVDL